MKIFEDKFRDYLSKGGWNGSFSEYNREGLRNKSPVGLFENMYSLIDNPNEMLYDFNISKAIEFSQAGAFVVKGFKNFQYPVCALKKAGFKTDLTDDPAMLDSGSGNRLFRKWLLPTLKDFIEDSKNEAWFTSKGRDTFLFNLFNLKKPIIYTHQAVNLNDISNFMLDVCSDTLNEKKIASMLLLVCPKKPYEYFPKILELIECATNPKLKDELKKNIASLGVGVHQVSYQSRVKMNYLMRSDYNNGNLSASQHSFFEEFLIDEKKLELYELKFNSKTYLTFSCIELNNLSINSKELYSSVLDGDTIVSYEYREEGLSFLNILKNGLDEEIAEIPSLKTYLVDDSSRVENNIAIVNSMFNRKYKNLDFDKEKIVIELPENISEADKDLFKKSLIKTAELMFYEGKNKKILHLPKKEKSVAFAQQYERGKSFVLAENIRKIMENTQTDSAFLHYDNDNQNIIDGSDKNSFKI